MLLNIDLHSHSRFSADGVAEPEDMVAEAKRKGLHGFAITDHNTCACVDYFEQHGYLNAAGTPVDGILIIPGQEITTSEGHLLALGVRIPDLKGIAPQDAITIIHDLGGLAIPPHPYDFFRAGIREPVLEKLDIDALEVFNAATTFKRYNKHAFEYAQRRGLPMTAASDAHDHPALGTAYTIVDTTDFTVKGVLNAIRKGPQLKQSYLTPKDAFKKTWNNVFRLRRKSKSRLTSDHGLVR
ncbi:MAG: metal-dependent phosphoesterase [Verrucomicrobia bacterium Tous-C9LFEB]|nr:MAG: metal-dependent phosphoesterase [Verrucomicrobia bacterium Tous-C9LFEB]